MADSPAGSTRLRSRLAAPLTEGAFVLVGILGAFSLQAWWESRQARIDEASRLSAVRTELLEARQGYERHLAYLNRQDSLAAAILIEASDYSGHKERIDSLLFRLGPFNEYDPPLAAYQDVVGAGGLSLVRSAAIRQGLARYGALVERDQREQEYVRDSFASRVAPLWSEYANVRDFLASGGLLPEGYPPVPTPPRYEELFRDQRFANQIAERSIQAMRVRARHRDVMQEIESLLALLEPSAGAL